MVILVDTREQRPLPFKCPTKRVKLDTGDYSVDGIQTVFRAERKRPKELWSCGCGSGEIQEPIGEVECIPLSDAGD